MHPVIACCQRLAAFTEEPGWITRTYLSSPMHDVHAHLRVWMESLGMNVWVDASGNLRGFYEGRSAARLVIGSHLDTVPHAGAYDGVLGVVMGVALVEALQGRRLRFGIEVIAFSEEEGVRYRVPFLGSRAVAGTLGADLQEMIAPAVREFGLDPSRIPAAVLAADAVAYLEFHIEQGPVLESLGLSLGVVEAIAGQSRLGVTFHGKANHAGTTPMGLRRDALTGAAEWIGAVERMATEGLVATVGELEVEPGAGNVVPGIVRLSLDVRHASDGVRNTSVQAMLDAAAEIAQHRGLRMEWETRLEQPAVAMDAHMRDGLRRAVAATGRPVHEMVSGAGHDAMILAQRVPAAMLFLRSPGGVSHHPDEAVLEEDVVAAMEVGLRFLEDWDAG